MGSIIGAEQRDLRRFGKHLLLIWLISLMRALVVFVFCFNEIRDANLGLSGGKANPKTSEHANYIAYSR